MLSLQDEAVAEASDLREKMRSGQELEVPGLTEELLAMAEYLGK